jgi:hypothetical protein
MLRIQRLGLVWSATIFFLVASPILGIYALGYDFDFKKNNLNNTISLSVETAPDNAKVEVFGDQSNSKDSPNLQRFTTFQSNSDVRIASANQLKVNLSKDNYLSEDFWVKGKQDDNSLVRLKKINLLPLESQKLSNTESDWSDVNFVSKDYIYFTKKINGISNIFLQQYSYGGFLGEPKKVQAFQPRSTNQPNLDLPINLDQQADVNLKNIPKNSFWEELDFETYWQKETQSLLFKNSKGEWQIWQSQFLGLGDLDLIWLGQNIVLLHDKLNTKNVYKYDLNEDSLTYITDNITAMSLNNNQIWFWFEDKLYKINKEEIDSLSGINWSKKAGYDLKNFEGFDLVKLYSKDFAQNRSEFKIKNQYQGTAVYINDQIYYQSDSQTDKWSLIATDVKYWTSTWHSIFWINSKSELQTYNLELKYQRLVGILNFNIDQDELVNLDYYASWHRIFVYKKRKNDPNSQLVIDSIWYNPDFVNEQIRTFSQKNWLSQSVCRPFVEGGYMFCFDQNQNLISYRNLY